MAEADHIDYTILGENAVDRILVDYQLAAQPAPCPTRFFTSQAEAMTWLLEREQKVDEQQRGSTATW